MVLILGRNALFSYITFTLSRPLSLQHLFVCIRVTDAQTMVQELIEFRF